MPYVKFNDRDNDQVFPWKSKQGGEFSKTRYDYDRKLLYGITIVNLTAIAKLLYCNLSVTGVILIHCSNVASNVFSKQ